MRLLKSVRSQLGNYHLKSGIYHFYRNEFKQAIEFFAKALAPQAEWIGRCLAAAAKAGDVSTRGEDPRTLAWFVILLRLQLSQLWLPGERLADLKAPRQGVSDAALRFMLRGLGVEDRAIVRILARR